MSGGLAQRAVACKGWRWMPGMLIVEPAYGNTTIRLTHRDEAYWHGADGHAWMRIKHKHMPEKPPDLSDPATLGCLLALVREAWGDEELHVVPGVVGIDDAKWVVLRRGSPFTSCGGADIEASALVAALEAAP